MNNLGIVDIKKLYTVDIIISQLNVSLYWSQNYHYSNPILNQVKLWNSDLLWKKKGQVEVSNKQKI